MNKKEFLLVSEEVVICSQRSEKAGEAANRASYRVLKSFSHYHYHCGGGSERGKIPCFIFGYFGI